MEPERRIEELFEEPPETWGLRGDPYLWTEMRLRLGSEPVPARAAALKQRIEQEFLALTGKELTTPGQFFVEAFAHGGMSSGYISPQFWRDVAIPRLLACQAEQSFTLKRTRWFACEFIGAEFGRALRAYAAIRVQRCAALKSGRGLLDLQFLRFPVPEDGATRKCRLQVLERAEHYLLTRSAEHRPARFLLFHAIDWDWMHAHLDIAREPNMQAQDWLTRHGS